MFWAHFSYLGNLNFGPPNLFSDTKQYRYRYTAQLYDTALRCCAEPLLASSTLQHQRSHCSAVCSHCSALDSVSQKKWLNAVSDDGPWRVVLGFLSPRFASHVHGDTALDAASRTVRAGLAL